MTSTYTPLGFNKQGPGDNANAWGDVLNEEVFDLVDEAIRGMASFTLSGTVTLTSTNGESNQARCAILNITGGTGGTVVIPDLSKVYLVLNGATGNAVVSASGGATATVEPNDLLLVICDGTNVRQMQIAGLGLKAYIDSAILATTGSLPATTGNEGKSLFVRSGAWVPDVVAATDVSGLSASAAAVRAGSTTDAAITPGGFYDASAVVTLYRNGSGNLVTGSAAGTDLDFDQLLDGEITLDGDITIPNPTNHKVGQKGRLRLTQDGTGSRGLTAVGSYWKRQGGLAGLTETAGASDYLYFDVVSSTVIIYDVIRNPT